MIAFSNTIKKSDVDTQETIEQSNMIAAATKLSEYLRKELKCDIILALTHALLVSSFPSTPGANMLRRFTGMPK